MFSALFAAYAVLADHTAGGPDGPKLFDRGSCPDRDDAACCSSSFTCGMCSLAIERRGAPATYSCGPP